MLYYVCRSPGHKNVNSKQYKYVVSTWQTSNIPSGCEVNTNGMLKGIKQLSRAGLCCRSVFVKIQVIFTAKHSFLRG